MVFGTNDGGSNPSAPASLVFSGAMVELVYTADSKSAGHYVLVGSSPTGATILFDGIAQLVEQVAVNHPVVGSSPSAVAT